jgi:hypothetical protein
MSKMSQKEAVFSAVTSVLSENNIAVPEGTSISSVMTRELRAQVNQVLFEGFRNGSVELIKEYSDTDLKAYVSGLQSNWLRKDKRLNGNTSYVAKNPGSRIGSSDPELKAMRALLTTLDSAEDRAEVQKHIDAKVAQIQATKAKKSVTIDTSALPAELAKFINQ